MCIYAIKINKKFFRGWATPPNFPKSTLPTFRIPQNLSFFVKNIITYGQNRHDQI